MEPGFLNADQATFLKDSDQIIGVKIGGIAKAYPLDRLRNNPGILNDRLGNMLIQIEVNFEGEVVAVRDKTGNPISSTFAYWFAWQAFHPDTEVIQK